jgi:hypothetical protein
MLLVRLLPLLLVLLLQGWRRSRLDASGEGWRGVLLQLLFRATCRVLLLLLLLLLLLTCLIKEVAVVMLVLVLAIITWHLLAIHSTRWWWWWWWVLLRRLLQLLVASHRVHTTIRLLLVLLLDLLLLRIVRLSTVALRLLLCRIAPALLRLLVCRPLLLSLVWRSSVARLCVVLLRPDVSVVRLLPAVAHRGVAERPATTTDVANREEGRGGRSRGVW